MRRRRSRRRAAAREPLAEALASSSAWAPRRGRRRRARELELAGRGRRRGRRGRPRRARRSTALTPQELHVALHVGRGLSNREVAGALFVSSRTVEAHLRQIYRKLDLRSRTELARLVAGLERLDA